LLSDGFDNQTSSFPHLIRQGYQELYAKHKGKLPEVVDFIMESGIFISPKQHQEEGIMNLNSQQHLTSNPQRNGELTYKEYYRWMNKKLTERIKPLAVALLGNPDNKRPTEWRWGKKGELVVYISGQRLGRFYDFESGAKGDALELVSYKTGYQGKDLSNWVKSFIGYQSKEYERPDQGDWTPIIPVPKEALKGDILQGLAESFKRRGMLEVGRYCYRDLEGLLGPNPRFF
jgi:hypothetical protein